MDLLLLDMRAVDSDIFLQLLRDDRTGVRPVSLIDLRHNAIGRVVPDWRWNTWREMAGVLPGHRKCSRYAALKIWLFATRKESKFLGIIEIAGLIKKLVLRFPDAVGRMDFRAMVSAGNASAMKAINGLYGKLNIVHRQRLYELGRKVGSPYSSQREICQTVLVKMAGLAVKTVGLGRKRGEACGC